MGHLRRPLTLGKIILAVSLPGSLLFLILARPGTAYYALPLASIALAAALYEFTGGTLAGLAAMAGVSLLIALDPNPARRAVTLEETWPILATYLAVGPLIGWLSARERERILVDAARQLHVVQEITQTIATRLDLEETLQAVIAETRRLLPFQRAAVLLIRDQGLQVVASSRGYPESIVGQRFPLPGTAAGWAVQHQRIWRGAPGDLPGQVDTQALCAPGAACLVLPLEFQERAIGVYLLSGKAVGGLTPGQVASLRHIGGHMAIALENARLYQAERERARHLAAIGDASREITASLELEPTLRLVMDRAAETLPMDAGALFRYHPESHSYRVAVSHNLSPDHVAKITFAFDEGVPGWVVKNRHSLMVADARVDARVHPFVKQEGVRSVLAVPLMVREQVVGVLNLYGKTRENAFDPEAMQLAEVFASQAAVAIENARLVAELRRAAAELEARVARRTRQLRATQAQAIRTEKLAVVGRLAASVAHEVNNPLQSVALQLQLIAEDGLPARAVERLQIVQAELDHIAGIVQRLLEFQRPRPGDRAPRAVQDLLDEVLRLAAKQVQMADIELVRVQDEAALPVMAAGGQLQQVFLNLVLNAVEAMPDGGRLTITTRREADEAVIAFSDTGVGLSGEVLQRLFEPFFSTKPKGSGLGLAISHEIITQHSGSLEAASQEGRGAIFTVRLPMTEAVVEGQP